MRHAFALLAVVLLTLGQLAAQADPFLIVPGKSIGQTHLGRNGAYYLKKLPPPTGEDASLGGNLYRVWQAKTGTGTLYIHTFRNDILDPPRQGVTVDEIRVTSPQFHTRGGIGPGSTLAQIRRRFSRAQPMGSDRTVYDDAVSGIAFEFEKKATANMHCIAVTIFPLGDVRITNAAQVRALLHDNERP